MKGNTKMANNNKNHITGLDTIEFNGKVYPTRTIYIKGFGMRTIAGESLEDALLVNGSHVSDEAKGIDESYFFTVDDKYLNCGDKQLAAYVERQVA